MLKQVDRTTVAVTVAAVGAVALYRHLRRAARLYVCGQQTEMLNTQLTAFLGWHTLQQPVKAAMPPFNRRPGQTTLPTTVDFNAPVFGPQIQNATMALFAGPEMVALAKELGIRIPSYTLSGFVQKKAVKVKALVSVARARADCASGANAAAITKLDAFITAFEKLKPADVPNLDAWRAFVGTYCPAGWCVAQIELRTSASRLPLLFMPRSRRLVRTGRASCTSTTC